jgi:hypothetical protein
MIPRLSPEEYNPRLSPKEYLNYLVELTRSLLQASSGTYIRDDGYLVEGDDDDDHSPPLVVSIALDLLENLYATSSVFAHPHDPTDQPETDAPTNN